MRSQYETNKMRNKDLSKQEIRQIVNTIIGPDPDKFKGVDIFDHFVSNCTKLYE